MTGHRSAISRRAGGQISKLKVAIAMSDAGIYPVNPTRSDYNQAFYDVWNAIAKAAIQRDLDEIKTLLEGS